MRNVLQRPHVGLRARGAATDQQHRRARERRVGDCGDALVTPGPAVTMATPSWSGQLGMGVRHVHGRAFVAHVDDADPEPRHVVPDRLDMTALQAEDAIDAARLEEARDPGGARKRIGVQVANLRGGAVHLCSSAFLSARCQPPESFTRSSRCRILPVAVRGMSCSVLNESERGRL